MDPKIKSDFLVALRSGNYKQTRGVLAEDRHEGKCHCAQGVLADLAAQAGVVEERRISFKEVVGVYPFYTFDTFSATLPKSVRDWAGIEYFDAKKILRLNDVNKKSFEEIADWVEENL